MCAEHARLERAAPATATADALALALSASQPRLWGWIAERGGGTIGYATATLDSSTWSARESVHMDCLFVRDA